jgi:hypothetical protein
MLERWSIHASEDACDVAMRAPGAGRVAPDEVFIAGRLPDYLRAAIRKVDPDAMIRDAADGWEEVVLAPEDARAVWPRLSQLPLPIAPGYLQGDFAGVPVRTFVVDDAVCLFVRPPIAHHLRRRLDEERW